MGVANGAKSRSSLNPQVICKYEYYSMRPATSGMSGSLVRPTPGRKGGPSASGTPQSVVWGADSGATSSSGLAMIVSLQTTRNPPQQARAASLESLTTLDRLHAAARRACAGGGFDPASDLARDESRVDELAGLDLVGGTDQGDAIVLEGEAVAAAEDGQGTEGFEAGGQPGQPVLALEQAVAEGDLAALGQLREFGAGVVDLSLAGQAEPLGQAVEVECDFAAVGHGDFAGRTGGQGAAVGGQVGEGHVDLMANGRDD